jgi:4-hydroxy-tetrahydrodipicolinate synthase
MFEGSYTALVTPFTTAGDVDFGKLTDLVEFQLSQGIDGIVPVGTTGESPTLSFEEHVRVVEQVIQAVGKRAKVIAGTGSNCTSEAIELTRIARDAGADGTLQVTPYYNRPSQEGLIRHFSAIADLGLPVMLYHVPGRTSCGIEIETAVALAKHPNIVAIKEAGGSVDRVSRLVRSCSLTVLSGDDMLALPMISVGARGVVSVASNLVPRKVSDLVRAALAGRWEEALRIHLACHELFTNLFVETNPVPVKAAMALRGMIEETVRLPLCELKESSRTLLRETLARADL